jgi:FkbM family methyltransferase
MTGGRLLDVARRWRRTGRVHAGPAKGLRVARHQASADYLAGTNELPVQQAMVELLRAGDEFVDIGANVGFFSLLAARLVGPAGRVLALEALPENVLALEANVRRNRFDQVMCRQVAVSDEVGEAELIVASHPGGAALAQADRPPDPSGRVMVRTVTVDALVDEAAIKSPRLVKVDVEGAEAAVLAGMARTLRRERPIVLVELDGPDAERLAARRTEVLPLLERAGYDVSRLERSYTDVDWCVEHFVARPGAR